jgi:hypothetical protein
MLMSALGVQTEEEAPASLDPPTSVSLYLPYGEAGSGGFGEAVEYGVQWANAEPTAGIQLSFSNDGEPDAGDTKYYVGPGTTQYDVSALLGLTLDDSYEYWYVRHALAGVYSDWVGPAAL